MATIWVKIQDANGRNEENQFNLPGDKDPENVEITINNRVIYRGEKFIVPIERPYGKGGGIATI